MSSALEDLVTSIEVLFAMGAVDRDNFPATVTMMIASMERAYVALGQDPGRVRESVRELTNRSMKGAAE